MAEAHSKQSQTGHSQTGGRSDATKAANPADVARRELVEWCQAHQLPVPAEHRRSSAQSNGR